MPPAELGFATRFLLAARELGPAFSRGDLAKHHIDVHSPSFAATLHDLWLHGLVEGAGVSHHLGVHEGVPPASAQYVLLRLTKLGRTIALAPDLSAQSAVHRVQTV